MKIRISVLLIFCVLFLCSCEAHEPVMPQPGEVEGELSEEKPETVDGNADVLQIGVSLQGLQRPFIQRLYQQLLKQEQAHADEVDLIILDGEEDAERQNVQIEEFIVKGVDAIIFNPFDYDEGAFGVDLACNNHIPIVLLTTHAKNYEKAQGLALSDHKESAYLQMEMVAEYLDDKGNIAIINGPGSIVSSFQRTDGYKEKLAEYPNIHVVAEQSANWSTEEAYAIVENWLRLEKEIDAIVTQNDNMAVGALQAVEEAGLQDEIAIFGIDGDLETLDLIKEGRIEGTVYHDAIAQADLAMECAMALAKGEPVEYQMVPYKKVDINNVNSFRYSYYG